MSVKVVDRKFFYAKCFLLIVAQGKRISSVTVIDTIKAYYVAISFNAVNFISKRVCVSVDIQFTTIFRRKIFTLLRFDPDQIIGSIKIIRPKSDSVKFSYDFICTCKLCIQNDDYDVDRT